MFRLAFIVAIPCLIAAAEGQWIDSLPAECRSRILWTANMEKGNLHDWTYPESQYPGGGVFNTGDDDVTAEASREVAHSGQFSAKATIRNAFRAANGKRAVRLMRWTDRPWDDGGQHFPRHAFYSCWMYLPRLYNPNKSPPWDPGDGGWWNVFQFKADDQDGNSQPIWTLNIQRDDQRQAMTFYLYSRYHEPAAILVDPTVTIPVRQWFHVEAYYAVSAAENGHIIIWLDGREILAANGIRTALQPDREYAIWGIGNYTDHITGDDRDGEASIYFDDSLVSTERVSRYLSAGSSVTNTGK